MVFFISWIQSITRRFLYSILMVTLCLNLDVVDEPLMNILINRQIFLFKQKIVR